MRTTVLVSVLCSVMLALAPAIAESEVDDRAVYRLSLSESLSKGLENNLDLVAARLGPEMAEHDVTVADAGFDMTLNSALSRDESISVSTNQAFASETKNTRGSVGVNQALKFGANVDLTLALTRQEQGGSAAITSPESNFAGLGFTFNMPLLQNFGVEPTTQTLLIARENLDISQEDFRLQALTTVERIEGAYWDLVGVIEALEVSVKSLVRAEDLLVLNQKKVEVGTLAKIEITQAEAGVASQEEGLILAETNLRNAEDELRRLLAIPGADPMWEMRIDPTDSPDFSEISIDPAQALAEANASRPELARAKANLRTQQLNERVARNRAKHRLDLSAGYTPQGVDLTETDVLPGPDGIPGTADDVFVVLEKSAIDDAIAGIPDLDNYSWNAGLTYAYPIGNRANRTSYAKAKLNTRQSEVSLQNQEQTIRVEVRQAVRNVESGVKRVRAAAANVKLQNKTLEAEQKKFDNGMSTSFEVLTIQENLAQAELSEIQAKIDYRKSLAAMERVKGVLLEARGLSLSF